MDTRERGNGPYEETTMPGSIEATQMRQLYDLVVQAAQLGHKSTLTCDTATIRQEHYRPQFERILAKANEVKDSLPEVFGPTLKAGDWVETDTVWGYLIDQDGVLVIHTPSGPLFPTNEHDCTMLNDADLVIRILNLSNDSLAQFFRAASKQVTQLRCMLRQQNSDG